MRTEIANAIMWVSLVAMVCAASSGCGPRQLELGKWRYVYTCTGCKFTGVKVHVDTELCEECGTEDSYERRRGQRIQTSHGLYRGYAFKDGTYYLTISEEIVSEHYLLPVELEPLPTLLSVPEIASK